MALTQSNPNHLLIGLGGTGGKILKAFKKRLYAEFPDDKKRKEMKPAIAFLYVDSTREMMNEQHKDSSWRVLGKDATFSNSEFCCIRPQSTSIGAILDNVENFPGMKYIVNNASAMKNTLGEIKEAAGQKRRAGRIMFASSAPMFVGTLKNKYDELTHRTNINSVHIHIFTGLAGGTGSGSIIDVISQTRKLYPDATIDVYAMIPEKDVPGNLQAGRYHQNGYAALLELNALNIGRFRPSDVITGEEHIRFADTDLLKQFSLILFSNVNDNGIVVPTILSQTTHGDSEDELLHTLVADSVYFRIFLKNTPSNYDFSRAWSCENLDEHQVEYDTKSKSEDKIRARTKATATFGIKRIIFPEKRIMQHISYTVSERLIWQMQYNNFKEEGVGYINEPLLKDYSEITKNEENLRKWMLDDNHLMLQERILETDKRVKDFCTFWKDISNFYSYSEAKKNDKDPLHYLEVFCNEQYDNNFRLKEGVESYYKDKSSEKPLKQQSMFILDAIEKYLYSEWYNGRLSMTDLQGYCEEILAYIKRRQDDLEGEVNKLDEEILDINNDLTANRSNYNNPKVMGILLGKLPKLYSEHQNIICDYNIARTERVAKGFEAKLLGRLRVDFEEFQTEMYDFVNKLNKTQESLVKSISERTRKDDKVNMSSVIVEVCKDSKMISFEERLMTDRNKMDNLASLLRKKLVNEQAFAHFGDLAENIEDLTVNDIADEILTPQIKTFHDEDDLCKRDPIIGINVLEQIKKLIDDDPDIDLGIFTNNVIKQCGEFLALDQNELNKSLNNNTNPLVHPESMNRRCIIVSMPDYTANDGLKKFGEQLEQSFHEAFGVNSVADSIMFDHSNTKTNEITIMQVRSCFPIRALSWLPCFKQEYDAMVNNPNEVERKQNTILLHCEGDGRDLPRLEGEGEGPKGNDLIKYFFLAASLDIIKRGKDDETEEDGWCVVKYDDWGNASLKYIAKRFTGLLTSDEMGNLMRDNIVEQVDKKLADSEMKKSEREACKNFIIKMMQTTIKDESTSTTSKLYKEQGEGAKSAIDMIMK